MTLATRGLPLLHAKALRMICLLRRFAAVFVAGGDDSPHLFFMDFWANDDAFKLARGLRAALDKTTSAK